MLCSAPGAMAFSPRLLRSSECTTTESHDTNVAPLTVQPVGTVPAATADMNITTGMMAARVSADACGVIVAV